MNKLLNTMYSILTRNFAITVNIHTYIHMDTSYSIPNWNFTITVNIHTYVRTYLHKLHT